MPECAMRGIVPRSYDFQFYFYRRFNSIMGLGYACACRFSQPFPGESSDKSSPETRTPQDLPKLSLSDP